MPIILNKKQPKPVYGKSEEELTELAKRAMAGENVDEDPEAEIEVEIAPMPEEHKEAREKMGKTMLNAASSLMGKIKSEPGANYKAASKSIKKAIK